MSVITQFFPTFDSALAACGAGYNDAAIADVIAYKTSIPVDLRQTLPEQAINVIVSVGIAAADADEGPLHVLDFGGGCGVHYFTCTERFCKPLKWVIVETSPMVHRGRQLARGRFELFTDIRAASDRMSKIDLILASGSIPYVPDPLSTLKSLVSLHPRYFALARFPAWGGSQLIGLQNSFLSQNGIGPMPPNIADRQVTHPVTFANLDEVMRLFGKYELVLTMSSPTGAYVVCNVNVPGITLIFRSKEMWLEHRA
jgi:putative methyltransferase (TIGR04325 family)